MRALIVMIAFGLLLAGCEARPVPAAAQTAEKASPQQPKRQSPFRIVGVAADRTRMDPSRADKVAIEFTIDAAAKVRLQIFDGRDALIWESPAADLAAGQHTIAWDGKDSAGAIVPPEAYSYVLVAENAAGKVVYDTTDTTGNEALLVSNSQWNPESGELRFRLDHAARINVRFGLRDGPYMRTVVDWVAREAGDQAVRWDGMDASRVLNLSRHPILQPTVRAFTLPSNTIFVGPDSDVVRFSSAKPLGIRAKEKPQFKTRMFFHGDQPLDSRGDIPVNLHVVGATRRDAEGRWVISGKVPIRLDVPAEARARVMQRRFEPALYADGIFVFEQEVGVLPLNWVFDSTVVNPGEHYLTANIRGYEGNYGAATLRVWVEPQAANPAQGSTP